MLHVALISAQLVLGQATELQPPQITLPEVSTVETTEPIVRPDLQLSERPLEELLDQARRSLEGARFPEAMELYSEVGDRLPGDHRVQYNRGVAAYRAGDLESAARAFERAAGSSDRELTQAALFNRGTASYRAALEAIRQAQARQDARQADGGAAAPEVLQEPIEALNQAIRHYRDAITASTDHRDARRNAELAYRLLKELQQEQDQQEQDQQQDQPEQDQQQDQSQQDQAQQDQAQQDQSQQDQAQQDQAQQDQAQQDQAQQDQAQQDQAQQDQPQQDQAQQDQPQQDQPQQDQPQQDQPQQDQSQQDQPQQDQSQQDQPQQDQAQQDQPQQDQPQQDQPKESQVPNTTPEAGEPGSGGEQLEARLSDEQAEALLQMIRDKEKQRRQVLAERAAREAARRYRPVERDW